MRLTICSNCGCNLTEDDDPLSPYTLSIGVPNGAENGVDVFEFDLCRCCAEGITDLLRENEEMLLNMHGENCRDILPMEKRCVHARH